VSLVAGPRAEVLRRVVASTVVVRSVVGEKVVQGSGTVVAKSNGYVLVLTCYHVVRGSIALEVSPTGDPDHQAVAVVESVDEDRDLALIAAELDLPALPVSTHYPQLYDSVYLLGAPFGERGLASEAIITDIDVMFNDQLWYRLTGGFMAGGISGGSLINAQGELIGVPARANKVYPQLGLAVPLSSIRSFLRGDIK
jgi:S1-C subfamily serine protease